MGRALRRADAQVFDTRNRAGGRIETEGQRAGAIRRRGLHGQRFIRVGHVTVTIPVRIHADTRGSAAERCCRQRERHAQGRRAAHGEGGHGQVFIIGNGIIPCGVAVRRTGRFPVGEGRANAEGTVRRLRGGGEAGIVTKVGGGGASEAKLADGGGSLPSIGGGAPRGGVAGAPELDLDATDRSGGPCEAGVAIHGCGGVLIVQAA